MTPFEKAVASLGNNIKTVTLALREKNIKGVKRSSCGCAVAEYLKTFGFNDVSVGLKARYFENGSDKSTEAVELPIEVRRWIVRFDEGLFPEFEK